MLFKVSLYVVGIGGLFLLPERYFGYLNQLSDKLKKKFKNSHGEDLLLTLSEYEGKLAIGLVSANETIPQFKFYTDLLLKLLDANRREGIAIRKLIPELRSGVQKDIQFEKKIKQVVLGAKFQFFVIGIATWGFVFFSQQLVEIPLSFSIGFMMLALQALGFISLSLISAKLKMIKFNNFSFAFKELYLFKSLLEVKLPINTILMESQIMSGALIREGLFSGLRDRLIYSVERWKGTGVTPSDEISELIKELWYKQDEQYLDFIKKLEILKFLILALLFLPAYFLYLAAIFKFFMEQ